MKKTFTKAVSIIMGATLCGVGLVACKKGVPKDEISVYMPDGAPALALAGVMATDSKDDGVTYRVVASNTIKTYVTANDMDKNADLCVMPVTAASKLLGKGDRYKMLGTVTHGNLYLISNKGVGYSAENLSSLIGKTVGVMMIADFPGQTLKATLNKHGIAWQEWTSDVDKADDKVNLKAVDASGIDGSLDAYLVAEPAASKMTSGAKGLSIVGDLQQLYADGGTSVDGYGYPQAVLVGKSTFIAEKEEWVTEFVEKAAAGKDWLFTATAEEIFDVVRSHFDDSSRAPTFSAETLTQETIGRCGVQVVSAKDCYTEVDAFLSELIAAQSGAAALVSEDFYWLG